FGAEAEWENDSIRISPKHYLPNEFTIEADWSAAGYWFSMAALAKKSRIRLPNLHENSLQADRVVVEILQHWGVTTTFSETGIILEKREGATPPDYLTLDFTNCPDLAQTIIVLSAATGVFLKLTGLESLKIKETDRVAALQTELQKIG